MRRVRKPKAPPSAYFPIHAHSEFSVLDGMGRVEDMVAKVAKMGQPGMALTDHGTMAGVLRLYKECNKHGLAAFPGSELYVVTDVNNPVAKEERFHMGMLALDFEGFKGMNALSSRSFQRDRFHRKPLIDLGDLADFGAKYGEHVAITTGCFFGIVCQAIVKFGYERGKQVAEMLAGWFPHTYVELQYHGIHDDDHDEDDLAVELITLADELGLPLLLGQDSHYCDAHQYEAHNLMKSICYFGDADDYQFPGGPYHLGSVAELREPWPDKVWDRIEEGHALLLGSNELTMPALDKYKFQVPEIVKKADDVLAMKAIEAMIEWEQTKPDDLADDSEVYDERITYELDVVKQMGFANYFLLVEEVTTWCLDNDVIVNARGSANGSLVCFLLGITTVDPIRWNTSFDRFLSLDRKKPPDVDLDIESRSRERVIEHLRKKFPTMVNIGTYNRMGITTEKGVDGETEDSGSVFVQYLAARRRKLGASFDGQVADEDRPALNALADIPVRKSLGSHAGGYVLPTANFPISDYLATALIPSSGTTVTQAVMEDVEDCGFVKLDLLGLRSLETLNMALTNIGKKPNQWSWMPYDDPATCKLLSSGNTDGIFQFEGFSTRKGAREMKIRNTQDAILCLALYRPALMAGGQKDTFLDNRVTKKNRPYRLHPFFDQWLDDTYSVPVFQEQIMEICRGVELPYEEWNDLMKAVKASNDKIGQYAQEIMGRVYPLFIDCCVDKGVPDEDAEDVWEAIMGFTDYGFNRAHATSYGQLAYRSAYLLAHHPLEYMQALLATWAGTDKERGYIQAARKLGISIGRPDINKSDVVWAIDPTRPNTLRKGFSTIKGIGHNAAAAIVEHRPPGGWSDMDDFISSVPARPVSGGNAYRKEGEPNGIIARLWQVGALSSIGFPA